MKYSLQTNQRSIFSTFALLISFLSLQSMAIHAQTAGFEAGLAGQTANMTSNVIGMNTIATATKNRGLAKIKSGRATTTFVHSPDIYRYMLNYIIFDETEPKTEAGRIKLIKEWVSNFEARMMKAGNYKLHDNVDAANFASILSYQARYDKQQLTTTELAKFRQIRQNDHQSLLKHAAYQGSPEQVKERLYIIDAMMSEQAIEYREKAWAARTSAERHEADQKAKKFAEEKLRLFNDQELRELLQAGKQGK
jgi:hypothetical protein